jgi:predicted ATPase/DNA-binding winged helix-turn-helix (wHTH) protein
VLDEELRQSNDVAAFGPFRLFPKRRLVEKDGVPIGLSGRALDILILLTERPGEVISKKELVAHVWPDVVVTEGSLRFHVSVLRKALGDGQTGARYVTNVPGRGYCFVAPILQSDSIGPLAEQSYPPDKTHNLPRQLARLVGRDETIDTISAQLLNRRFITVVGPGGIGKTSVAISVASALLAAFDGAIRFVDLGPLTDPQLVPGTLASLLGLPAQATYSASSLVKVLGQKRILLVFDSCEHVIETASELAQQLIQGTPHVHILATSRESLRVEGEQIHRLFPLAGPPDDAALTAAEALSFPAAQLFVERVSMATNGFSLCDADAPAVANICRKLDGIPLAIELAAARIDAYGIGGTSALLDDRFRLFWPGRRTALPRHQTLSAALDWSYDLLPEFERIIFRRLSVFVGNFTLEAARFVAPGDDQDGTASIDAIASLVAKSLVTADSGEMQARYRLLDTTRAYAAEKLKGAGEAARIGHRHANYYRQLLEATRSALAAAVPGKLYAACVSEVDNIRAALKWALGNGGDAMTGVALASASAPFWLEMSMLTECKRWTEAGLHKLDEAGARSTCHEMVLQNALCTSDVLTRGFSDTVRAALTRAGELAEMFHDIDHQMLALVGLATHCHRLEQFHEGLSLGRRAEAAAREIADPLPSWIAHCLLSTSYFFLGEYADALSNAQKVHRVTTPEVRRAYIVRIGLDRAAVADCVAVQVLFVRGFLDQAADATRDIVDCARALDHPYSLCLSLTWSACPITLALGDFEAAQQWTALLKRYSEKYDLKSQYACALGFEGRLAANRGETKSALTQLRACLMGLREAQYESLYTVFLDSLAETLAAAGHLDEALAAADEALQRTERNEALWWMPEALRMKGELLLRSRKQDTANAEELFRRSLALSHRQGALFWELRTATSLGRLQRELGHCDDARAGLLTVCDRFSEGFDAKDFKTAKGLLDSLTPRDPPSTLPDFR